MIKKNNLIGFVFLMFIFLIFFKLSPPDSPIGHRIKYICFKNIIFPFLCSKKCNAIKILSSQSFFFGGGGGGGVSGVGQTDH